MSRLGSIGLGAWDFVVGDGWRTAAGVVLAIAATPLLAGTGAAAWWLLRAAVAGLLVTSLRRAARAHRGTSAGSVALVGLGLDSAIEILAIR